LIVLATHDLDLVEGLVTRGAILRDGRLAALYDGHGSVRERYTQALAGSLPAESRI
jgi:hypothetical protein